MLIFGSKIAKMLIRKNVVRKNVDSQKCVILQISGYISFIYGIRKEVGNKVQYDINEIRIEMVEILLKKRSKK